jgi:predicted Zn-dependent protease
VATLRRVDVEAGGRREHGAAWRRARRRAGAAVLPALLGCACSLNPVTQVPEVMLSSPERDAALGEQAAQQVAAEVGLVEAPALQAYLELVGRRVAARAPGSEVEYRFQIVDMTEPNAFALPGGYVYVSRGLLALTNDEDELANVVAHEVVHVAARHHAQRQTRAAGVGLLALPALVAGALLPGPLGDVVAAPFAVVGLGALAAHGRDQERQADEYGQRMAAQSGYDPGGLVRFLASLDREVELLVGERENPSFFDTHPTVPSRVEDAARRAGSLAWTRASPVAADSDGFLHRVDGLLVGENPAEGVFEGQRFLHPDLDISLVFPPGWRTINTRAAVGAISEGDGSQVVLSLAGPAKDPREAASSFLLQASRETRIDVARTDYTELNGLEAVRVQAVAKGRRGPVSLDLTWLAHAESVYLISGIVSRPYTDADRSLFAAVAESFRSITDAERSRVVEQRLRLREARAGESLEEFGSRTGNAWSALETAVANGLEPGARLAAGQLLKVALEEPYAGGR